VRTLLPDPPPAEFEAVLEARRRSGADRRDEVWEGVIHTAPAPLLRHADLQAQLIAILHGPARAAALRTVGGFNLGAEGDYRIPGAALVRPGPDELYLSTAALVVEILSRGDETWDKLAFYAGHDVDELLIVDPEQRTVDWRTLAAGEYTPIRHSALIDLAAAELAQQLDWPPSG
jgi:Uma2 family endonuclease